MPTTYTAIRNQFKITVNVYREELNIKRNVLLIKQEEYNTELLHGPR